MPESTDQVQHVEMTVEKVASKVIDKVDLLKYLGNWGLAGTMVGYLVMFTLPETRKEFSNTLDKLSAEHKDERKEARTHGSAAAKDLAAAITKNAESIENLNETFIRVQERTQENQRTLIELQLKKMEKE